MTAAIEATDLGVRYGRRWALRHTTLGVPTGKVVGLVGANGAGKSTLLQLAVGLIQASEGEIRVLGEPPGVSPQLRSNVGFVAQDAPIYSSLSVADHLRLGAELNPSWASGVAEERIVRLGLDPQQKAGSLSGGQRSQLALTMAIGKGPELLLLDEPVASLDPLARRQFLQDLMVLAADGLTIVLSSHLIEDLERVCDYLIVLSNGRACLSGDIDDIVGAHHVITSPRLGLDEPIGYEVIARTDTARQSMLLVRGEPPAIAPTWSVTAAGLDEIVLAYMEMDEAEPASHHGVRGVA